MKYTLGIAPVSNVSANSSTLINCCDKLLEKFHISDKYLSSVVTDGAIVIKSAASNYSYHCYVCLCHVMHNCVKNSLFIPNPKDNLLDTDLVSLNIIDALIERAAAFGSHLNRSSKAEREFIYFQRVRGKIPIMLPVVYSPTR